MSNPAVGSIYSQIIERCVAVAQNDFEEAGLEQETLQELKQQWQQNISKLHVAQCPWDPAPPQPQITNTPTLPSNVRTENSTPLVPSHQARAGSASGEPHIKQEAKHEGGMQSYPQAQPNGYGGLNPGAAAQRANQLLQQQYGSQAQASIHATAMQHQQQRAPQGQQRPTHIQLPGPGQGQSRPSQSQQQQQPQYSQHHSTLSAAQTDGPDDGLEAWNAIVLERRAQDAQDRAAADGMLRRYVEDSAAVVESGLMMPLREHPSTKGKRRKAGRSLPVPTSSVPEPSPPAVGISQMDGGADDELDDKSAVKLKVEDEDAINSDLDDSDDGLEDPDANNDDGPLGETILCTYDKVQRVKNKWKCTLKDGILTTGNREYVFHKATGEFEW